VTEKRVAITVDLEDWFQVENLREHFPPDKWSLDLVRFKYPLAKLLELLDKYKVKATFFVLGWIAERFPETVKELTIKGHEVASHGMSHMLNSKLSNEELKEELRESKKVLERITGRPVLGYRAPSFTISDAVLKYLQDVGYKYDSSLFPFSRHKRYGRVSDESLEDAINRGIKEFRVEMGSFMGKQIPFAGGAYFRMLPLWFIEKLILNSESDLIVMYFHPWEFDPDQPKVRGLSLSKRIRHYYGLRHNLEKVENLLGIVRSELIEFVTLSGML